MTSFESCRLCDEPAAFVAKVRALANAPPDRTVSGGAYRPQTDEGFGKADRLSAEQLCARYGNENLHTEHVTGLALQLFDATHRWVGVARDNRALLEAAGRLHDVAYQVDPVHHLERSAEITWREGLKGFSVSERACIAAVILFHAGRWKDQLDQPILKEMREPQQAMRLGAFLRIADGLDWGHVQDAAVVGARRDRTKVLVSVRSDWFPANLSRADQKADLWREVFPLDIRFVPAKSRRPRPMIERSVPMSEGARRLLSVEYKTILAHLEGGIAGDDPEHLHRIRVAIRRLRRLLRVFRKALPDVTPIDQTLRLLGDALGTARDLDVWVAFLHSAEIARDLRGNRRWQSFVQHHEQMRRLQLSTVRRELRGARFNALRRRMAKLLRAELSLVRCADSPTPLGELAARKFLKELRRVRGLSSLRHSRSPKKLHCLRCGLRRARYLGEFFGPVLGKSAATLTRRLHQAEKPLARIHDLDVALSLIRSSGPPAPCALTKLLQVRHEQEWSRVEPAWRRLVPCEKQTRHELQARPGQP